jgi:NAD(P)-dependent dehydrogenase (short-subunit alcohol dehydrogenase family)
MAKIIVIGAFGTIGTAVADLLAEDNEVTRVGHQQGDLLVDLGSKASIKTLFEKSGVFDALVCAAGVSRFGSALEAHDDDFAAGIDNKLMGQVNLVRLAPAYISENGSITITSGLLGREPGPGTAPTALVNAGLEGFVRAAALDVGKGIRINVVSPIFVTETAARMGMGPSGTMSAAETAKAYKASVFGDMTGQTLDVREYGAIQGA